MGPEAQNVSDQDNQNIANVWRRCRAAVQRSERSEPCNHSRQKPRGGRKLVRSGWHGHQMHGRLRPGMGVPRL
jgi:hypothetical protein